jgi:hypothetical protein
MKIAAIDYGFNIGLVVATLKGEELKCSYLTTLRNSDEEAANLILSKNCDCIVMEDPPYNSLGGSANSFYKIHGLLMKGGYLDRNSLSNRSILRYLPGQWKPFVQSQSLNFSMWNPMTQHEKDAMGILWYALRINLKKEIKYV